jgi:hypothetical protein
MQLSPLFPEPTKIGYGFQIRNRYSGMKILPFGVQHAWQDYTRRIPGGAVAEALSSMPTMGLAVYKIHPNEATDVKDIIDAENQVFAQATTLTTRWIKKEPLVLIHDIIRSCSLIARFTRRGAGNMAFMHQDLLELILHHAKLSTKYHGSFTDTEEPHSIGRWDHKMVASNSIRVYTTSDTTYPRDEINTCYVGTSKLIDGPGSLFEHDGQLSLYLTAQMGSFTGNASDFVDRVKIANLPREYTSSRT